jgi:3-methyladenine DNA glycosylase Tag
MARDKVNGLLQNVAIIRNRKEKNKKEASINNARYFLKVQ